MSIMSERYELQTVLKEATLVHRANRFAPVRAILMRTQQAYWIVATSFGTGVKDENALRRFTISGDLSESQFDAVLSDLEDRGYELVWEAKNGLMLSAADLICGDLKTASPQDLPHNELAFSPYFMQRVVGGVRVSIIVDAVGEITICDPHTMERCDGLTLSASSEWFVRRCMNKTASFVHVFEAFYSDKLGLQITDIAVYQGKDVRSYSVPERQRLGQTIWDAKQFSSQLKNQWIVSEKVTIAKLRQAQAKSFGAPNYVLRHQDSVSAIGDIESTSDITFVSYAKASSLSITTQHETLKGVNMVDLSSVEFETPARAIETIKDFV